MSTAAYNSGGYIGDVADKPVGVSTGHVESSGERPVQRAGSGSSYAEEKGTVEPYVHRADDDLVESQARRAAFYKRFRPFILAGVAAVILGWWISSTILKATRHRWHVIPCLFAGQTADVSLQDRPVSVCLVLHRVRMHFFRFNLIVG